MKSGESDKPYQLHEMSEFPLKLDGLELRGVRSYTIRPAGNGMVELSIEMDVAVPKETP